MTDLADRFRREGMADAVVLLVAKRIHPATSADDWGRALGLQQHEVRAAITRFRERGVLPEGCEPPKLHSRRPTLVPQVSMGEVRPIGWKVERDAEIRRMHDEGLSNTRIAECFGVTPTRVGQILQAAG